MAAASTADSRQGQGNDPAAAGPPRLRSTTGRSRPKLRLLISPIYLPRQISGLGPLNATSASLGRAAPAPSHLVTPSPTNEPPNAKLRVPFRPRLEWLINIEGSDTIVAQI